MPIAELTADCAFGACAIVGRGNIGLHAGIAYRRSDRRLFTIHLAWHYDLRFEPPDTSCGWLAVSPSIDPIEQEVLSGLCEMREGVGPVLPYGLDKSSSYFDPNGNFIAVGPGIGLTCATFVMAMFDWAGITLLDTTSWRDRPADRVAQENLVDMLRRDRRVSRQHIEAVEREVGCFRYRSEEVAAGSASQVRPLTFDDAEAAGQRILEVANEIYANA